MAVFVDVFKGEFVVVTEILIIEDLVGDSEFIAEAVFENKFVTDEELDIVCKGDTEIVAVIDICEEIVEIDDSVRRAV